MKLKDAVTRIQHEFRIKNKKKEFEDVVRELTFLRSITVIQNWFRSNRHLFQRELSISISTFNKSPSMQQSIKDASPKFNMLRSKLTFNSLHIISQQQLDAGECAVKIQRAIRRWLRMLNFQKSYQQDQLRQKSARTIQHWVRNLRYSHRCAFFKEMSFKVGQIQSTVLFLQTDIYLKLPEIIRDQQSCLKFLEQHSEIYTDQFKARLKVELSNFQSDYEYQVQDLINVRLQTFPASLIKQMELVPLMEAVKIRDVVQPQSRQSYRITKNRLAYKKVVQQLEHLKFHLRNDIYALLHQGCKIEFEILQGRQFIKFIYPTIVEARYRMISLAILSYRFKYGSYIEMFDEQIYEFPARKLDNYFNKIENIFRLRINHSFQVTIPVDKSTKELESPQKFEIRRAEVNTKIIDMAQQTTIPVLVSPSKKPTRTVSKDFEPMHQSTSRQQSQVCSTRCYDSASISERVLADKLLRNENLLKLKQQNQIILSQKKQKIIQLKEKTVDETAFITDFSMMTSMVAKQEQKFYSRLLKRSQQQRSSTQKKEKKILLKNLVAYSVPKKESKEENLKYFVYPQSVKQPRRVLPKLSDSHRYTVFPEELYAISDKSSICQQSLPFRLITLQHSVNLQYLVFLVYHLSSNFRRSKLNSIQFISFSFWFVSLQTCLSLSDECGIYCLV